MFSTSTLAWSNPLITPFTKVFTLKIAYNTAPQGMRPGGADENRFLAVLADMMRMKMLVYMKMIMRFEPVLVSGTVKIKPEPASKRQ